MASANEEGGTRDPEVLFKKCVLQPGSFSLKRETAKMTPDKFSAEYSARVGSIVKTMYYPPSQNSGGSP
jgi:hypothetical protein